MLIMYIKKEDESYFDEILVKHPESIDKSNTKGFNEIDWVKLIIETSKELLPIILTSLEVFLAYMAVIIQSKDLELHNREVELLEGDLSNKIKCDKDKHRFEIKVVYGGKRLTYTDDDLKNGDPKDILKKIAEVLEE